MRLDNNKKSFFPLLRAGLWETEVQLLPFGEVDFGKVLPLAEEQSVVGLVVAGLEHVTDCRPAKKDVLQFIGHVAQLEQRNHLMNEYISWLIERLRKDDIYAILVKGQGIAQCYERPMWRASGDVDLLLNEENYQKAKRVLMPLALGVEREFKTLRHLGMTMAEDIVVELHGTLNSRLSKRIDRVIGDVQRTVFCGGMVRPWDNNGTTVFLPAPDEDVVFVFTHILHHFYIEGVGLRQICDWCRLLWTYRKTLDVSLLERRLKQMGLMTEWKAFAAMTVSWLGMPVEAMPLYSSESKWKRKAAYIMDFVIESGNFGHNRYVAKGKLSAIWQKTRDFVRHTRVFPWDAIKFFWHFVGNGIEIAAEKRILC